jgi:NTE family protein
VQDSSPSARGGHAKPRVGLVLSGGGARGAYEVGVLAHIFEHVLPQLPPDFDFDVVSGTSVGAIHASYVVATAQWPIAQRARQLAKIWAGMELEQVVRIGVGDLLGVPLRALGFTQLRRRADGKARAEVIGGLVDVSPLERIVAERIPWADLRRNLDGRPRALCVLCTEIRSGHVAVFMDGGLADPAPWASDPNIVAIPIPIGPLHVRASAAIPFLFPAVRIGDSYYVDGGLRMNTPLSPALRLGCDRLLVVALKHRPAGSAQAVAFSEDAITQPAFLIGKVLDALILDQLEVELHRLQVVNALLRQGTEVYGDGFVESVSGAVRERRGAGYRVVETAVVRPSEDIGRIAAHCYRKHGAASLGALPSLLTRFALRGVPEDEADLLSYVFFDRRFTADLVALGREDAKRSEAEIVRLLGA